MLRTPVSIFKKFKINDNLQDQVSEIEDIVLGVKHKLKNSIPFQDIDIQC